MASIYPDEAIDLIHGIFPKNGVNFSTLYIGLFTSQTATTVPDRSATGGSGWTEATGTGYARQSIASSDWGTQATEGDGRKTTANQVTFPAAGSGGWGTVNGFFIATESTGGSIIYFANFDDETAVTINAGDIIRITPSMTLLGVA